MTFGTRYRPSWAFGAAPGSRRGGFFGDHVVAQAQRLREDGGQRLRQRRDAAGVDRLHLLGQGENAVQFGQRGLGVGSSISSWARLAIRFTSESVRDMANGAARAAFKVVGLIMKFG
jgi:hypothetical protein